MVGRPARAGASRQSPIQPSFNQAQPDGRQSGYCQRGTANYGSDPTGRTVDRDQLRVSADDGEDRVESQPFGASVDLVSEGPLSVYRPDLAWHDEAGWGRA